MNVKKITEGYVEQVFDEEGNCLSQKFVAGDHVEFEDENNNEFDLDHDELYHPFDMVQPKT